MPLLALMLRCQQNPPPIDLLPYMHMTEPVLAALCGHNS